MNTNRRDFIKTFGIATVCACTGIAGFNSCSMIKGVSKTATIPEDSYRVEDNKLILDLNRIECLSDVGGAGKLSFTSSDDEIKIIVLHHEAGKYKAFSDRCTHGGRELNYKHSEETLQCSSFGRSTFKLTNGHVIKGPAEGPLAVYPLQIVNNTLIVTFA